MENNVTYSLWLEPSGKQKHHLKERIEELSSRYNTPSFNPHVTLMGGVKQPKEKIIPLLNSLADSANPISISLTKAGYREQFYQCLFVHVQPSPSLLDLRKKTLQLFDASDNDYMPHLSLMYGDFDEKHKQEIISRMGSTFDIHFKAKHVALIKADGKPKNWQKIHSSSFK